MNKSLKTIIFLFSFAVVIVIGAFAENQSSLFTKNDAKKIESADRRSFSGVEMIAYRKAILNVLGKENINDCVDAEVNYRITFSYNHENPKWLYIYFTYLRKRGDTSKLTDQERLDLIRKETTTSEESRICVVDMTTLEVVSNVRQR